MKKGFLLIILIVVFSGCVKELTGSSDRTLEREFTASFGQDVKTSLGSDYTVSWSKNDTLSYYTAGSGAISKCCVPFDCSSFSFSATVGEKDTYIVAAYGGTISENTESSLTLSGAVPAEQSGKFKDAHVAVCRKYFTAGKNLSFKNATSLIEFSLTRTDVSYLTFTADDTTKIQGNGKLCFTFGEGDVPSAAFDKNEGGSTIRVNTDGAGTFYIATLPCTIEGFSFEFFDSNDVLLGEVTTDKTLTLNANEIVSLGEIGSKIVPPAEKDLSELEPANCYIVSKSGAYKFKSVKGNSTESVGDVKGVKVLWESFGTSTAPTVGDLVRGVTYSDGYVKFTATNKKGNALIAAYSDSGCTDGNVLWSWHIWMTDEPEDQIYNNAAGIMMDRNLGATSASKGDVKALGLLYQWGRKDPFLGGRQISYSSSSDQQQAASTITWPESVSAGDHLSNNNTLSYSIANPTTYIYDGSIPFDWYCLYSEYQNDNLWKNASSPYKTIYDPCPAGYRVPDGEYGELNVWSTAFGTSSEWTTSSNWDSVNYGMDFGTADKTLGSGTVWYPAAGNRDWNGDLLKSVGTSGYYWSCTPYSSSACYLYFYCDGKVSPTNSTHRVHGQSVRCIKESSVPEPTKYTDLSATGTANCYIVSTQGKYKFKTVKGNSTESVGTPTKAEVLWETFGTSTTPTVGDLVKDVTYSDGYVKFTATDKKGNAVIAAKDASGNILWSWHIWMTDAPANQEYKNNAGTMMDRNLGATSATPGDVGALGLLYQWGRKDPFLGSLSISSNTQAASTLSWPSAVHSDASNGTIAYAVAHPTTFILYHNSIANADWYYTGTESTDNTRWQTVKTIYDPCPQGWRVPDGGSSGVWSTAFGKSTYSEGGPWNGTNKGMNFGSGNGKSVSMQLGTATTIWYPASGVRHGHYYSDGSLSEAGVVGFCWSCTPNDYHAYSIYFDNYDSRGYLQPSCYDCRAHGLGVRCIKESSTPSTKIEPPAERDLSELEPANCYIVSTQGDYKFKTVKGNSNVSVGTPTKAEVLWETFGTSTTPTVGDLVKDVTYSDGYVKFTATDKKGNAVIAAKDASGNILWSWHIWMTDAPASQEYKNNAGTMMDRNLGATSATPGDVGALGLLYQWGRKDPFLSSSSISSSKQAASTLSWPSAVHSDASNGTIAYAVAHPTTFILYHNSIANADWYYTGTESTDNTRWQTVKTIYDPCPQGWRVPDGGSSGVWSTALVKYTYYQGGPWDGTNKGMNFGSGNGKSSSMQLGTATTIWYPASGHRLGHYYSDGSLDCVGDEGFCWSCTPKDYHAYSIYFDNYNNRGFVSPSCYDPRAHGYGVRCVKE